jgi:hypothetical protein
MKIEIIEKEETVVVRATIPRRKYAKDPNVHVDASNIRDFLNENNVNFGNCIKDNVLANYTASPKLEGDWVFINPNKPKIVVKTESEKETNEESEPAKPTTKRRRRRRPATTAKDQFLGTEDME